MTKPKWWQTALAAGLGAGAGWSNAAGRTRTPIDIGAATEGILHPGYQGRLEEWQSRVMPVEQWMTMQEKAEQIGAQAEERRAHAQQRLNMANPHYGQVPINPEWAKANLPFRQPDANGEYWMEKTQAVELEKELGKPIIVPAGSSVVVNGKVVATGVPKPGTSALQIYIRDHPNATAEEVQKFEAVSRPVNEAQAKDVQIKAEFAEAVGKDPAAVTDADMNAARRMFGSRNDLQSSMFRRFIEEHHGRLPNAQESEAIINKALIKGKQDITVTNITGGAVSDEALNQAADLYNATGHLDSYGSGTSGTQLRQRVMNRAAERHKGADLASARTDYTANKASIADITKNRSRVMTSEGTASRNLDLAARVSAQVDRTGSPLINKYLLFLKGEVAGDDNTQLLNNAVETAANEYANVVTAGSGGGVAATDSAREHARSMLHSSMADGTFQKVVKQMKIEMANRRKAFDDQLAALRSGRTQQGQGAPMVTVQIPGHPPGRIPAASLSAFQKAHPDAKVQ